MKNDRPWTIKNGVYCHRHHKHIPSMHIMLVIRILDIQIGVEMFDTIQKMSGKQPKYG